MITLFFFFFSQVLLLHGACRQGRSSRSHKSSFYLFRSSEYALEEAKKIWNESTAEAFFDANLQEFKASVTDGQEENFDAEIQRDMDEEDGKKKKKKRKPETRRRKRWCSEDELALAKAIEKYGPDEWDLIARDVGSDVTATQIKSHVQVMQRRAKRKQHQQQNITMMSVMTSNDQIPSDNNDDDRHEEI